MKAVVYACVSSFAVAAPSPDVLAKFHQFRAKWGHTYVGTEYHRRAVFFEQHLREVEHLQQIETGTATYSYLGPFADLSRDEMAKRSGILLTAGAVDETKVAARFNMTVPTDFDWVSKGAVNPIQDQGQCGSCWAFSAVAALEGEGFVSGFPLVKLSEQEVVDCSKNGDQGCNGGLPSNAMTWVSQGGLGTEASYRYTARDGTCRNVPSITHCTGYISISKDEDQMQQSLVTYGPLSIAVDATPFQSYSGGVMQNPRCSKTKIDHGVNIVGYGTSSGVEYWKIRNSWGTGWGEAGYIRIIRNECACALCTLVVAAKGVTESDSPTPTPPAPPTPPTCQDKVNWCPSSPNWECEYVASYCQRSCGCCGSNPPSYCASTKDVYPESILDEIKKLVCQYVANGDNEAKVEELICSKFGDQVATCDQVVKVLWSKLEQTCAPSVVV